MVKATGRELKLSEDDFFVWVDCFSGERFYAFDEDGYYVVMECCRGEIEELLPIDFDEVPF